VSDVRCAELVEEASGLLDGAPAAPARARLAAHLPGCEGCRRYLDQVRATVRALGGVRPAPGERLPDAARERLRAAFARSRPSPPAG
jgi:predicted anti-sigma-YlaC factor YlaD